MKVRVNYRGAYIDKNTKGNITRTLKRYFDDNTLRLDEETKTDLYVRNTVYPRYEVIAYAWEVKEDVYEITVYNLKRKETTSSVGTKVIEKILVDQNKSY